MGASQQALQIWDILRAAPKQIDLPLPARREAGEHAEDFSVEPTGVMYQSAPEVDGIWAIGPEEREGAAILYLFGGGYVISSPHSRRKFAGHLAVASGARVLVPNYRLAPEHPFPSAVADATRAYTWLLTQDVQANRSVISGDSSGGGLTLATLLNIRDRNLPRPAGGVAISPWADLTCGGASFESAAVVDLCVTRAGLLEMADDYLDGADPRQPLISPAFGDFCGLPPLLVLVGSEETLLDDSIETLRAAARASLEATLHVGAGMQHVYPLYVGAMPEADAAVKTIGAWIKVHTGG
jgi:acetyl esterase/lipase